jgi:hypothetical protein
MVIVKSLGRGNMVHFAAAGNYFGFRPFTAPDMQRLLVNAADWVSGSRWVSADPRAGTVPAHSSLALTVTVDATTLSPGTRLGALDISSNDPVTPRLSVPITAIVSSAAALVLAPDSLDFAAGGAGLDSVQVSNTGSEPLHVTSLAVAPPFRVPSAGFDLAAGASRWVPVTFEPTEPGTYRASLVVSSDDPEQPVAPIPLVGTGGETTRGGGSRETLRGSPPAGADGRLAPEITLALHGLVPNPPLRELMVSFTLPDDRPATVELLDLAGRRLRSVEVAGRGSGRHSVSLGPAGGLGSSVYMVRLRHGGRSLVRKCVLMR